MNRKGKEKMKSKGTIVPRNKGAINRDDDEEKATALVKIIEATDMLLEVPHEKMFNGVKRQFISCMKQFFTIAELHNHGNAFRVGSPEDKVWLGCLKNIVKLAKDKTDEMMQSYVRYSREKSKERIEEEKRRSEVVEAKSDKIIEAGEMKASTNVEAKGEMVTEDEAKGEMTLASREEVASREEADEITDDQEVALAYVHEAASKLIAGFNFEGAFFLALSARHVSLAPWICNQIDKPLADLSLTLPVLLSLLHQLAAGIATDKSPVRLGYMRQVVEIIEGEQMFMSIPVVKKVRKEVIEVLERYKGEFTESVEFILEALYKAEMNNDAQAGKIKTSSEELGRKKLAYVHERVSTMIEKFNFEGAFFLALSARQVSLAPWICNTIDKPLAELSLTLHVLLSLLHQLAAGIATDKSPVRLGYMRQVVEIIEGELMMFMSIPVVKKVRKEVIEVLERYKGEFMESVEFILEALYKAEMNNDSQAGKDES